MLPQVLLVGGAHLPVAECSLLNISATGGSGDHLSWLSLRR